MTPIAVWIWRLAAEQGIELELGFSNGKPLLKGQIREVWKNEGIPRKAYDGTVVARPTMREPQDGDTSPDLRLLVFFAMVFEGP
jgi:hypothetical protein